MIVSLTIIGLFLDIAGLGSAVLETAPGTYLNSEEAYTQALAATEAATPDIPEEVLLGLAWVESRYYPTAVSRVENGKRVTGIPKWKSPPKGTHSFFCGVTQISAGDSWEKCRSVQDVYLAYRTAVKELTAWMSTKICNRNLRCALAGYDGGFQATKYKTSRYAEYVLQRSNLIKNTMKKKAQT